MRICKDGRILGQNNSYHKSEYIRKQSESHSGPMHWKWKGGASLLRIKKYKDQKDYLFSKENLEKIIKLGFRSKKGKKNPMYGNHHSESTKAKMSEKKKFIFVGRGNPNWHGGLSFEPYSKDFSAELKEKIRKRDNYECQKCFKKQEELRDENNRHYKLIVHHKDMNKKNNRLNNLLSLCRNCHLKLHFETN